MPSTTACAFNLSTSGISAVLQGLVCPAFAEYLPGLAIPDENIHTGHVSGTHVDDYHLSVSGGTVVADPAPIFCLVESQQGDGGLFTLQFSAAFGIEYASWHESGKMSVNSGDGDVDEVAFDHHFNYVKGSFKNVALTFTVQFSTSGTATMISSVSKVDEDDVSIEIPKDSEVSGAWVIHNRIGDKLKSLLAKIDFAAPLSRALEQMTSADSVHLTNDIVFEYPCTGMAFPEDLSLSIAVSGRVCWKGQPYDATLPALDFPTPTARDIHLLVADYDFNALLWAYYKDGMLDLEITKDRLPDPSVLETDDYSDPEDGLYPLYEAYPDCDMVAHVRAAAEPTVETTDGTVTTSYTIDVDFRVLQGGEEQPAFVMRVIEVDTLTNLALGTGKDASGKTAQIVMFDFHMKSASASLLHSDIPGIDDGSFHDIWKYSLRPLFADVLTDIGKRGVPLPRPRRFLFSPAQLTVTTAVWSVDAGLSRSN